MRVLVTNDDGIDSIGLRVLAGVAVEAGCEVVVAAPHTERSGSSAALTVLEEHGRLGVHEHRLAGLDVRALGVEATPAFIAMVAARGAFGEPPDLVASGMNHGPNTGHAVLHSGTVGAALTAATFGAGPAAGIRRARLAAFGAVEGRVAEEGQGYVTVTFSEIDADPDPGTDVALLRERWATVTPLRAPCEAAGVDLPETL
jgi:5'-nucleotidase